MACVLTPLLSLLIVGARRAGGAPGPLLPLLQRCGAVSVCATSGIFPGNFARFEWQSGCC